MTRRLLLIVAVVVLAHVGAMAQTRGAGPEQALMDLERAWAAASLKSDAAALDAILAATFTATSTDGKVISRAQALADAKGNKLTRSEVSDMKVTMLGPAAAVVTGVWSGAGTTASGQKIDTTERWTDVFVNEGGKWKCVTSQATTIKK